MKVVAAYRSCILCPRACKVDRLAGEYGICGELGGMRIASVGLHFGEEPILVGSGGSGTIFFTGCSLHCQFCQNMDISQARSPAGTPVSIEELATLMRNLQRQGAININVVTPTHFSPSIIASVKLAQERGLQLPLVYNTSGYECVEVLKEVDPMVDLYLLDIKTLDRGVAAHYCGSADYPEVVKQAVSYIAEHKPTTWVDRSGNLRGTLVRHLIYPNTFYATKEFLHWYAETFSEQSWLSLLTHFYTPSTGDRSFVLSPKEYEELLDLLASLNLHRGYISCPDGRSKMLSELF
ncbi:MAG TPA: radical SAM protein [Sphaerochaeta sp.]|nr:radical SAM protein [Sphaerochaeta sp.]